MFSQMAQREVNRRGARAILMDPEDRVLHIGGIYPRERRLGWSPPGGGLDEGEEPVDAVVREVYEETGLRTDRGSLVGPVAVDVYVNDSPERPFAQENTYFFQRVERFDPVVAQGDDYELDMRHVWIPVEELRTREGTRYTRETAELVKRLATGDIPDRPVFCGFNTPDNWV
ncbi:NUDIX domain-containing protein [Salininema proteolyticum]|uniref:NUDIX domain-containing protein n=1 Tax=Salininema proteolyticum TaxID=1607685 RepID=A0ABV8TXC7_9ACTN